MMFKKLCPILLDLPKQIHTPRLTLRPAQSNDGTIVYDGAQESFHELKQWLPWANTSYTPQQAEATMRQFHASYVLRSSFHYLIFKNNSFIGMVGLSELNWDIPSAHVEFWCRTNELGNGYITEALQALTLFAFDILKIRRLHFVCDSNNERAKKLAERAHYKLELIAQGLLKKPDSDELRTCHQYSCYQPHTSKQFFKIDFEY